MIAKIGWAALSSLWYVLPLVVIALILLIYRYQWQRSKALLLGGGKKGEKVLRHFSLPRKIVKGVLLAVGLLCLMLAIARPQWDDDKQTVAQEGRSILIALDISRSMLSQDMKPSRLEFAKQKIRRIIDQLRADQLGLMVFSDTALIQCPFTRDTQAFLNFLNFVDAETISSGSTSLDSALSKAIEMVKRQQSRAHTIMVIFTDGEDFSLKVPDIRTTARQLGLSILTVGVGTAEGAPIPLYNEQGALVGHQKDQKGTIVISRLNEPLLEQLSGQTGAEYIKATQSDEDIEQLVRDIRRFEKEKFTDRTFAVKQEKFTLFALLSFLALLLEWVVW